MNQIDPKRDIWGALISEKMDQTKKDRTFEKQFLFVGAPNSGKTSLQNAFFGKTSGPSPTLAINYQTCSIYSKNSSQTIHFWELGGGMTFHQCLDSIAPNMKDFTAFVVFDLMKYESYQDAFDWIEKLKNEKLEYLFLVGSHYDEFEDKDPSDKLMVVSGLKSFALENESGLFFFSNKGEMFQTRIKSIIKSIVFGEKKDHERVVIHTQCICFWYADEAANTIDPDIYRFLKQKIQSDIKNEAQRQSANRKNPDEDELYNDDIIDPVLNSKLTDLRNRLSKLVAYA